MFRMIGKMELHINKQEQLFTRKTLSTWPPAKLTQWFLREHYDSLPFWYLPRTRISYSLFYTALILPWSGNIIIHTWKLTQAYSQRPADCRLTDPYSALFASFHCPWLLGKLKVLRKSATVSSQDSIVIRVWWGKKKGNGIVLPKTLVAEVGRDEEETKETDEGWK